MPEAPTVTTTATSSAQGTPTADASAPKTPAPATTQAAPVPSATTLPAPEPAKVEAAKEPAKPAAEPAKEGVKADEKPAAEAPKTQEAPKEVLYDIPFAEGAAITKEEIEVVKAFSKEHKYSNEQAFAVAEYLDNVKAQNKALTDEKWLKECQDHPQYGKDKYGQTSENIKRYLERVAPKLIPLLESSRYGNHPDVFAYFAEQAARGTDDTLVSGKQAVTKDSRTPQQKLADEYNAELKKR